jgi:Tol biopolymer transport system component
MNQAPDRLQSWKEIASFLGCEPRTAQRYELQRGLPVHRLPGGGVTKVYAYRHELQAWLDGEAPRAEVTPIESAVRRSYGPVMTAVAVLVFVSAFVLLLIPRPISLIGVPTRLPATTGVIRPPLMTDGQTVFYQENHNGKLRLMGVPLTGSAPLPLPISLPNPDPGAISPDRHSFLLRSIQENEDGDEPLYRQAVSGGSPVRLGGIRAYDSAWTPDGTAIIFSRQRDVYLASPEGVVKRKLFDVPGRAYWFRWSPDRQLLRFTVYDSRTSSYVIWETPSLDSAPNPVSFGLGGAPQCCGNWSSDGESYFFQSQVSGYWHIFGFQEHALPFPRPARQLTHGTANFRSPLPSPGAGQLFVLNQNVRAEVSRFDPALRRWLPLFEGVSAATASFSPDGKSVVFTKLPDHSLWRCTLPFCSQPVPIVSPPNRVTMPRWSPDGRSISFMIRQKDSWRAAWIPANGSTSPQLIPDPGAEADPVWNPTSTHLAFGATPNPDTGSESSIRIFNLQSKLSEPVPGSRGLHSPSWSPSGDFLAAVRAGSGELCLYDFSSRSWTTPLPGISVGYLNWSLSGDRLFFLAGRFRVGQTVMSLDVVTGKAASVANFDGLKRPGFSFGDWLGLGPGNTLLALRDLSSEEILVWPFGRS